MESESEVESEVEVVEVPEVVVKRPRGLPWKVAEETEPTEPKKGVDLELYQ